MAEPEKEKPKIQIPLKKIVPKSLNPRNLIIFSKPKTGKTILAAELPNALILDFEDGSEFVSAMKIKVSSIEDLKEIKKQIEEAKFPYEYVVIDTVTAIENITIPYAEQIYSATSPGKNWFKKNDDGTAYAPDSGKAKYGNILNMPEGAGYSHFWSAHTKVVSFIRTFAPRMIQLGHVKDTSLDKSGAIFNTIDLDVRGKLKRIVTSDADGIGYMYRKGNQNIISFKTTDEVACGIRSPHLTNQELVISEMIDGVFTAYWDKIYTDLNDKKTTTKNK